MTIPDSYRRRRESSNAVLQAHMQSTTQTVRVIERRRQTIYSTYSAHDCPPSVDLALGTLASVATLSRVVGGHTAEMVAIARKAGASWSQIGEALGVSKQAAHKQFRQPPTATAPTAAASAPRIRSAGRPE
ncbi:MAG: hypothetical protein ACRDRV_14130 [Pseudonocardiaceae bacterium]